MKHATKLLTVALLALTAALVLSACGSGSDTTNGSTASQAGTSGAAAEAGGSAVPTIVIRNGEPVGGIEKLEYTAGEDIRFKVRSDIAEEVHFHGYELMKDVTAGGIVSFDVPAEIEGIFEVELEGEKEQIAEIRVNP